MSAQLNGKNVLFITSNSGIERDEQSGVRDVINVQPLAVHCLTSASTQPAAPAFSRSMRTLL